MVRLPVAASAALAAAAVCAAAVAVAAEKHSGSGVPRHVHVALSEAPNALRVVWFAADDDDSSSQQRQQQQAQAADLAGANPGGGGGGGSLVGGRGAGREEQLQLQRQLNSGSGGGNDNGNADESAHTSPYGARGRQVVEYGFAPGRLEHVSLASALRVGDHACDKSWDPKTVCTGGEQLVGTQFVAELTALEAAAAAAGSPGAGRVYYRVGGGVRSQWSPEYSVVFRGASAPSVEFLAFGDMGTPEKQPGASEVSSRMAAAGSGLSVADFVLHAGDMAYAFEKHSRWATWFSQMEPVMASAPYMIAYGNRDDAVVLDQRFVMPASVAGSSADAESHRPASMRNRYYAFDMRFVRVLTIDTNLPLDKGSVQYAWFAAELEASARRRDVEHSTAWIVVLGHRPMWSSSDGHDGGSEEQRKHLEPLFRKYGVDLAIWGDDHSYERTWPIDSGKPVGGAANTDSTPVDLNRHYSTQPAAPDRFVEAAGTVHTIVGTGGCKLDGWVDTARSPDWSAYRTIDYGWLRVHATPREFTGQFIRAGDHAVMDTFTLASRRNEGVYSHYGITDAGKSDATLLVLACIAAGAAYYWYRRNHQQQQRLRGGRGGGGGGTFGGKIGVSGTGGADSPYNVRNYAS